MVKRLIIFLMLFVTSMWSQVPFPPPGTPMSGKIGPGGNFPLLNGGWIDIGDADYTMKSPEWTASVLQIRGNLTQTRTITKPVGSNDNFGFEFTIQNATTGGHDIVFKASTGAGVTIPFGKTMMVIFDGTNYVAVGAPSGGAGPGGGEPSGPAGGDLGGTYPNPTVLGLQGHNLPTTGQGNLSWSGTQWNYTPPLSDAITINAHDYGVKADAKMASCNTEPGSHTVECFDHLDTTPQAIVHFTQDDINKPILIYSAGNPTGLLRGTISVVSGGHGGVDGLQPVIFTDDTDGCITLSTMPYGYVNVVGGVPTGDLVWPIFKGDGCIHPPTKGQVATVTGETTFTGGYVNSGDWPTVITGIINEKTITVRDAPPAGPRGTRTTIYGTDDVTSWERACNAHYYGHITFVGASVVSRGINCENARFHLEGMGYGPIGTGPDGITTNSAIVYAGRGDNGPYPGGTAFSRSHDHILLLHGGWGAKIERVNFRGNSMAKPFGIKASFNRWPLQGNGIAQSNFYQQVWFGPSSEAPDTYGNPENVGHWGSYQLQSCIYADAAEAGNVDFATIEDVYCLGAEVGFDANNSQATAYRFGNVHVQISNIGTAVFGGQMWNTYYTEANRLDIAAGSPTDPSTYAVIGLFDNYGGESSTKAFEYTEAQYYPGTGEFDVYAAGLGLPNFGRTGNNPYMNPTSIWIDAFRQRSGHFKWRGMIQNQGKIRLQSYCGGGGTIELGDAEYSGGIRPDQVEWIGGPEGPGSYLNPACEEKLGGWFKMQNRVGGRSDTDINVMQTGSTWPNSTTLENDNFYQKTTGSILVRSPRPPGQLRDTPGPLEYDVLGTPGSKTYHYQVSCIDGRGLETNPSSMVTVSNGPATLSSTNRIVIVLTPRRGCDKYVLYGDAGGAEMGYLTEHSQSGMEEYSNYYNIGQYPNNAFYDEGKWGPPQTSRKPPVVSLSGVVDAEHGFLVKGVPLASTHLSDFAATAPTNGQVPVFNSGLGKYVPGTVSGGDGGGNFTAGGDLSGSGSSQTVVGIRGHGIAAPSSAGYLHFNGSGLEWAAGTGTGDGGGGGGPTSISDLTPATKSNRIEMYNTKQSWAWSFGDSLETTQGLDITEGAASTNSNASLLAVSTYSGSHVNPLTITSQGYYSVRVDPSGNLGLYGGKFKGPLQLPTPEFANTILATNGTGDVVPAHGVNVVSSLTGAVANNYIDNGAYQQIWKWDFTSAAGVGMSFQENTPKLTQDSALVIITTAAGSQTLPLQVYAGGYQNGFFVDEHGNPTAYGATKFIGPVQLPAALASQAALGTDEHGNIIGEPASRVGVRATPAKHPAGSIACWKDDNTLGSCQTAMTGTPPHCTCQ